MDFAMTYHERYMKRFSYKKKTLTKLDERDVYEKIKKKKDLSFSELKIQYI